MTLSRRSVLSAAGTGLLQLAAPHVSRAAEVRTLRFVPQANLSVLDPVFASAAVTMGHGYCVFDTLYGVDGAVAPASADGRRRQSCPMTAAHGPSACVTACSFHDGTPVRAIDCAASLERWSKRDTFGQTLGQAVERFGAADDRTVLIKLKRPFPRLLMRSASPIPHLPSSCRSAWPAPIPMRK